MTPPNSEPMPRCKTSPHCSHNNTNGRDLDKPCSISYPSHPDKGEEWRKKLDDTFPAGIYSLGQMMKLYEIIQELLEKERQAENARIRQIIEGRKVDLKDPRKSPASELKFQELLHRNDFLTDLLSKIKI